MEGLDGINTCQRLKHDAILKDIPVVGMTSSDDLKFTEKAFRAGAELFLTKPFQAVSLVHVVELALSLSQRETSIHRRRRHPRLEASVRARCIVGGPAPSPQELVGQTANVSLGGLLVCLPAMLASGTLLRLGLNLPDGVVTAHGTVMWIKPQSRGDQRCCHGVRLLGFTEHDGLLHYRRFLSQVAGDTVATPRP